MSTSLQLAQSPRRCQRHAVWLALCLFVGACAPLDANCIDAGLTVHEKIPRIQGYIDTTGNGCNISCEYNLLMGNVDYVDLAYTKATNEKLLARFGNEAVSFRLPPHDGTFRVSLNKTGACEKLKSPDPDDAYSRLKRCLQFVPVDQPTSQYEMKAVFTSERTRSGIATMTNWTLTDTSRSKTIAAAKSYAFSWNQDQLVLPGGSPDYHCPGVIAGIVDLKSVYGDT